MRLLLGTHTFLWAITDDPKLGPASRELITHQASGVFLSHVSLWEIAIKHTLAREDMPLSAGEAIPWAEQSALRSSDTLPPSAGARTVAPAPPRSVHAPEVNRFSPPSLASNR